MELWISFLFFIPTFFQLLLIQDHYHLHSVWSVFFLQETKNHKKSCFIFFLPVCVLPAFHAVTNNEGGMTWQVTWRDVDYMRSRWKKPNHKDPVILSKKAAILHKNKMDYTVAKKRHATWQREQGKKMVMILLRPSISGKMYISLNKLDYKTDY